MVLVNPFATAPRLAKKASRGPTARDALFLLSKLLPLGGPLVTGS